MLKFLGRGSAFADEQTSAVFTHGDDLVIIDCPFTAFIKLKRMNVFQYRHIYVLITHTHGDHAGGLGTFVQYVWFGSGQKKKVTVIAPSEDVAKDLHTLLDDIEGCKVIGNANNKWYYMKTADHAELPWLIEAIPTTHVEQLKHKCFGYKLCINKKIVIYTGDTATFKPFQNHLTKRGSYLYTEISSANVGVHLWAKTYIPIFNELANSGINVYLMHMDDEDAIKSMIAGTKLHLAPKLRGYGIRNAR